MENSTSTIQRLQIHSEHFDSNRVFISLEILTQCNFRCSYCYIFENPENAKLIAADDFKDTEVHKQNMAIIDKLGSVKTPLHFYILGGEPTIYQGLDEIIAEIYGLEEKYGCPKPIVEIITNGRNFEKEEYTKKIMNSFPDVRVTISLHWEYMMSSNYQKALDLINQEADWTKDTSTLYILLPDTQEHFDEVGKEMIRVADLAYKSGKTTVIFSIVNGYDIRNKGEIIDYYIDYFEKAGKSYLLQTEFVIFSDPDTKEQVDIGRFQFLKANAEARVDYKTCHFNNYVIDKTGQVDGNNCSIIKGSLNLFEATPEEINEYISVRPLICTIEQCPVNCTCMPKRNVRIKDA